ncbi:hypothetical protein CLOP_g22860 [Closterium sp. NIES-67]|nr:hypothetical protein CLOP_g22860 [Closterium sp. NIES-67]
MAVDSQEAIRVAFLLEPGHGFSGTDGFDYLGARRFLLKAKAQDGTLHRQHWQHVSGVGYADFRAFLRAQRDTWRREREGERDGEREASREEERSAAAAAPYADAAPSSHSEAVAAGQKDQGEVDVGEAGTGEVVERKDSLQEVVGMVKIQAEGMISVAYREDQVEGGEEGKGEGGEGQSKVPAASATAMAEGTIASDADASTHDVPGVGGTAGSVAAAPSAAADTFNRTELALPSVSTSSSSFDSVAAAVAAALGNAAPVPFTSESAPTVSAVPSTAADTFNCSDGNTKGDAPPSASSSGVDSIAAAVAAALGKAEPAVATASEAAPAADGHGSEDADSRRAAGADSGRAASREGLEGGGAQRGSEGEEVAIRVSAASGASAGGEESDGERAAEGGGKGEAAAAAAALDSKQQDSKQPSTPPSPPPLPAGFSSSICSVPPEASRNVLPPPPPRSGSVGSADSSGKAGGAGAEGKKGARRGSEGAAGREGSAAGRPLERRKSVGETAGSGGKGGVETGPLVRMSAVFEDCLASVNKVQFSRHHPDLLAYGAADGTFRLCYVPCNTGGAREEVQGGRRGLWVWRG